MNPGWVLTIDMSSCLVIREGKASRTYWRVMTPLVNAMIRKKILLGSEVRRAMDWLDLKDEDLRINQPHGAYDPPQHG